MVGGDDTGSCLTTTLVLVVGGVRMGSVLMSITVVSEDLLYAGEGGG